MKSQNKKDIATRLLIDLVSEVGSVCEDIKLSSFGFEETKKDITLTIRDVSNQDINKFKNYQGIWKSGAIAISTDPTTTDASTKPSPCAFKLIYKFLKPSFQAKSKKLIFKIKVLEDGTHIKKEVYSADREI